MNKFLKFPKAFSSDTSGNVAMLFGMMAVPMFTIVGGALDFSNAVNIQNKMQKALDSAAMAVCSAGSQDPTDLLKARLELALSDNGLTFAGEAGDSDHQTVGYNQLILENATFNASTGEMAPSLSTNVRTYVLSLIGIEGMPIEVSSTIACGAKRLELSVMLDVTGSMGSWVNGKRKLDSMKEAAHDVVDMFETNMNAGATRIALVPFSEAVNVGNYANAVRGTVSNGTSWSPGKKKLRFWDRWGNKRKWKITKCVSERTGSERYTDAPPSVSPVGKVYTSSGSCKPSSSKIVPLTNDAQMLRSSINSYVASGGTAGHIGTAWAWYMLSDKWGYLWPAQSQPEQPNPDELIKATILMTDGEYNEEYYNGVDDDYTSTQAPNGSSKTQAERLCDAMKDPNGDGQNNDDGSIVVYTVGFGLNPNSSTAQRLKSCATDATKYFFPYNGDELRAAFAEIGRQLAAGQAGKALVTR